MGPDVLLILIVVLAIVLIARGPSMLPRIGEALGRTVKSARTEIPSAIRGEDETSGEAGAPGSSDQPGGPGNPQGS